MPQDSPTERNLIGLYAQAEQVLLAGLLKILRQIASLPPVLRAVQGRMLVHRLVANVNDRLGNETPAMVAALIAEQSRVGGNVPPPPPGRPPGPPDGTPVPFFDPGMSHGDRAARQIRNDLVSELDDVRYRITRLDDDVYKAIAPEFAVTQVEGHNVTPLQAQARAWQEFLLSGVTGFTDKSGRDWRLSSYVEMAVRTASARAFNAARMEHIASNGGNLVFVSDDGHPCPQCLPWQNRVLCITPDGVHPTVDEATAGGLFHPNCKHHLAEYFPGHTHLPDAQEWTPELQDQYNATQRQRALERAIRSAKQDALYANTAEARLDATRDVRRAQAKLRQFLADNPQQLRRSKREQPDLSYPTIR